MITRPLLPFFLLIILGIIFTTTFAYASQDNLVVQRGEGVGQVSGVIVTDVHYELSQLDPGLISSVDFATGTFNGTIKIQLVSSSNDYYPCTRAVLNKWNCNVHNTPVSQVDNLRVIALGS